MNNLEILLAETFYKGWKMCHETHEEILLNGDKIVYPTKINAKLEIDGKVTVKYESMEIFKTEDLNAGD